MDPENPEGIEDGEYYRVPSATERRAEIRNTGFSKENPNLPIHEIKQYPFDYILKLKKHYLGILENNPDEFNKKKILKELEDKLDEVVQGAKENLYGRTPPIIKEDINLDPELRGKNKQKISPPLDKIKEWGYLFKAGLMTYTSVANQTFPVKPEQRVAQELDIQKRTRDAVLNICEDLTEHRIARQPSLRGFVDRNFPHPGRRAA